VLVDTLQPGVANAILWRDEVRRFDLIISDVLSGFPYIFLRSSRKRFPWILPTAYDRESLSYLIKGSDRSAKFPSRVVLCLLA
jgi:hypothetical protein